MDVPLIEDNYMAGGTTEDGSIVQRHASLDYQAHKTFAATDPSFGVAICVTSVTTGEMLRVCHFGPAIVRTGASFAVGDLLTSDGVGRAIKATAATDRVVGSAMEAATAADQAKLAFVAPGSILGGTAGGTIPDGSITLAKLADLAADRIIGRANAAGTGVPQALTAGQVRTIIGLTLPTGAVVGTTDTQTLSGKTIALGSNTVSGTLAEFNTALTGADFASLAGTETLTGKTLNLTSNTLAATLAQLNAAVSDADVASLAGAETLSNKTLASPLFSGAVGGAKAPSGSATGTLTSATHSGGIFTTTGNVVIPNEAGFSITLLAGGAHTVGAGGATIALATGDVLSILIPAVGTVRYSKMLAADVGTLATS